MLLCVFIGCIGCSQISKSLEEKRAHATWEAEQYPWAFNPINTESQLQLCQALGISTDDEFCHVDSPMKHQDIYEKMQEHFPINKTMYSEVEAKLGHYPHSREETRQPDGTLVGIRYAYRLSEYEGACIYFQVNLADNQTIERIGTSGLGTGPSPTTCGPTD